MTVMTPVRCILCTRFIEILPKRNDVISVLSKPLYRRIHTSRPFHLRGNLRLIEVGKFESPILHGQYEPGQLFYHRVFGYRGIILFPWQTKVYDKDMPFTKVTGSGLPGSSFTTMVTRESSSPSQAPAYGEISSSGTTVTSNTASSKAHTYYMVMVDARDQECVRVRTRVNPLNLEEIDNDLVQLEGIDHVGHEDIQPYVGTEKCTKPPINHAFFNQFFFHKQESGGAPQCAPTEALHQCSTKLQPILSLTSVYKETTEDIRVTVLPFYIGSRATTVPERTKSAFHQLQSSRRVREYWWRYCIRLENIGAEPCQLRERKWCVYTTKMTTISGRGVVGEEPVLSKEQPAFQYVSMISLDAPSGHMWGKYKMEKLHSGIFFDCEIPNFSLESKASAAL